MFIVKKAPADRTAGADCLEGEQVMFGNQYAFTVLLLPDLSSGRLSCVISSIPWLIEFQRFREFTRYSYTVLYMIYKRTPTSQCFLKN